MLVLLGPFIIIIETRNLTDAQAILQPLITLLIASSVGWGIYKKNKIATTSGLILALVAFIGSLASEDIKVRNVISALVSTFMFLHSTRGIFAYHKMYKNREINDPEANNAIDPPGNKRLLVSTGVCGPAAHYPE